MKNKHKPNLEHIIYISIPEDSEQEINGFLIDSTKLMPVEVPAGEENWHIKDLSWEMIIAAMLKIFAWDPEHEDIEYYRNFIKAVRPGINGEMTRTGILKAENKDYGIAEEIFRSLAGFDPSIEQNLINLALVFEEQAELYESMNNHELAEQKTEEAFEIYKSAGDIHPDSEDILFNAGNFFLKHGNMDKAVKLLNRFMTLSDNPEKKIYIAEILEKIKNISSDDLLFNESYELIKIGKENLGIDKIKQYLEDNPDVWNGWFLLGWAYRRIEKYEEGKEALLKCLELNPENVDSYNELAICLLELGEYSECRKKLGTALRLDGENIKIISNFGILSLKENNQEEALGFFRTVLEIEPDDPIALKYIEFLTK